MPVFTVTGEATHIGRVLGERERNMLNDSDFIARVWIGESPAEGGHSTEIEWGTTRAGCGKAGCQIDATEQVREWWHEEERARIAKAQARAEDEKRRTPVLGSQVRVVGGRKHKGAYGIVSWYAKDQFSRVSSSWILREKYRAGVMLGDDSKIFVPAEYLEILVDGKYVPSFDRTTWTDCK